MARLLPSKPGWYPNPEDGSSLRYWDGREWASRYRPCPPWTTGLADVEPWRHSFEGALEGPVHPHELREPVTSGASAREGPALWRAFQAQRAWHRPSSLPSESVRPPALVPATKFASARRPLMYFVAMVVVAVVVVICSVAVMAPYERAGQPSFAVQPANARFVAAASRQCGATLPEYHAALLTSSDGPSILAATRQMDLLRTRLSTMHPSNGDQALVEAWLSDWQRFTTLDRRYADLVGSAHLSSGDEASALQVQHQALLEAQQADHFLSNLDITACRLNATGAP